MNKLRVVVGLPTFDKIFQSSQYTDLRGGLLEAMGTLFQDNVKLYLYPYNDMETGEVVYPNDDHFENEYKTLWKYLVQTRKVLVLNGIEHTQLKITNGYISELIENADVHLENYIPEVVYKLIKEKKLFGYGRRSYQNKSSI